MTAQQSLAGLLSSHVLRSSSLCGDCSQKAVPNPAEIRTSEWWALPTLMRAARRRS